MLTFTSKLRKPPSWAAVTRGDGSNHSHDFPNRLRNVLTEETVTEPEQRARINTPSLHQLTSTSGWYCSLSGARHRGRMKQYGDSDYNLSEQRRRRCITFSSQHQKVMTIHLSGTTLWHWSSLHHGARNAWGNCCSGPSLQSHGNEAGGGAVKVWPMFCWHVLLSSWQSCGVRRATMHDICTTQVWQLVL